MSFEMKTTEISISLNGLHITTVMKPTHCSHENGNEAELGDFHMSVFTLDEWVAFSKLVEQAIQEITK